MPRNTVLAAIARRLLHGSDDIFSSSSSSSSSDEEWEAILSSRLQENPRIRIPKYEETIARYSDDEFKSHFRVSKETFNYLHEILLEDLVRTVPGCQTISPRQQLIIALWKMASKDSYRLVCSRFDVARATAVRAVRRVTEALCGRASEFIQWPSGNRAEEVMRGFQAISGFPKIIGAIDGTHIQIETPEENAADYKNAQGHHSIQLQLVCDHKASITHCYVGHPGSLHDFQVFHLSEVAEYLNDDTKFPHNSHIIGDGAYEIHQHLLTPFRDGGHLTDSQKLYNSCHSTARGVVDKCIGLLKGRMRSLLDCLPMKRIDLMPKYVIACCVLHNICVLRGDEINIVTVKQSAESHAFSEPTDCLDSGIQKRLATMKTLHDIKNKSSTHLKIILQN